MNSKNKIFIISILILMVAGSCFHGQEKTKYKELIPEKDFISILYDLNLTNGLFALPDMRTQYMIKDTSQLYVDIIEGYGYTTGAMDTTIQYYYIKKPKKLIKIYDEMLGRFSEMEMRTEKEYRASPEYVADQWKGEPSYLLPDPGGVEKPGFELTMITAGDYALKFSVTIYPDDQSDDPCFTAWICNIDSAETGVRTYLLPIWYIKDGRPHSYTIAGFHPGKTGIVFKGFLYDSGSNPDSGEKNAMIEDISFYYSGTVR
ncbi:MAG: DUF4296 domain-containing protein [Bacteroidia bacterium]|nr:DUF4296 domain-containing protein [Bacteroidia bacterium]